MKPSCYLKAYPVKDNTGYLIVYSTKKTSSIMLNEQTYHSMLNGALSPETLNILNELGMIVSDRQQERKNVLETIDNINKNSTRLRVSIVLNLECNFDCIYCYEGNMKGRHHMNEETAGIFSKWIKNIFTPEKDHLRIDFYGGEPLLNLGLIVSISREMKSFTERNGAEYSFAIVTNGSLFRRETAKRLLPLGLKGIKTTLDGPPDVHNRCRPFRNGAESFDTIVKNIYNTCDLTDVSIGGNFTKNNFYRFPELMDYLENEGLAPENIHQLKFDPVMERRGNEKIPVDYNDGIMSLNESWIKDAGLMLREEVLKRGYSTPRLKPTPCQVERKDAFVVNYDGLIYKCPVFVGNENYSIGNIQTGIRDYKYIYNTGMFLRNEECMECEYLPLCFGGCRYLSYVRDGAITGVDCRKRYFESVMESLIRQDIIYGMQCQ